MLIGSKEKYNLKPQNLKAIKTNYTSVSRSRKSKTNCLVDLEQIYLLSMLMLRVLTTVLYYYNCVWLLYDVLVKDAGKVSEF